MFITLYIYDLLLFAAKFDPQIYNVMQNLQDRFWITYLDDVLHYLDREVDINLKKRKISFWQLSYLKKILAYYGISDYQPAQIFISPRAANSLTVYEDIAEKSIVAWYQLAIGAFMWPDILFCIDLVYLVKILSCFSSNPRPVYIQLLKHVL